MKYFTEQQVTDLIKLKFGQVVEEPGHLSYVPNRVLGKIFGVSGSPSHCLAGTILKRSSPCRGRSSLVVGNYGYKLATHVFSPRSQLHHTF